MPDAPPLQQRRPVKRTGFNVDNPAQHRPQPRQPAPALPQRPTVTRGFQPLPAIRPTAAPTRQRRPGEPERTPRQQQYGTNPPSAPLRQRMEMPPMQTLPTTQRRSVAQSKDLLSQITGMTTKVPLGDLLHIAPSVRRGVTSLLDSYERTPANNFFPIMGRNNYSIQPFKRLCSFSSFYSHLEGFVTYEISDCKISYGISDL